MRAIFAHSSSPKLLCVALVMTLCRKLLEEGQFVSKVVGFLYGMPNLHIGNLTSNTLSNSFNSFYGPKLPEPRRRRILDAPEDILRMRVPTQFCREESKFAPNTFSLSRSARVLNVVASLREHCARGFQV